MREKMSKNATIKCDFSKFSSQREVKTPSPGSLRTVHQQIWASLGYKVALGATVAPFPWAGGDGWIQGGSFVSHTKFQVFMSIRSLIRSFCKIVRVGQGRGGEGGDGWILGCNPVSHTKFQVSMSIRSLIRSFCQIKNDEKSSFFISFSSKNDDFTISDC